VRAAAPTSCGQIGGASLPRGARQNQKAEADAGNATSASLLASGCFACPSVSRPSSRRSDGVGLVPELTNASQQSTSAGKGARRNGIPSLIAFRR
jgi:hypothetical protein